GGYDLAFRSRASSALVIVNFTSQSPASRKSSFREHAAPSNEHPACSGAAIRGGASIRFVTSESSHSGARTWNKVTKRDHLVPCARSSVDRNRDCRRLLSAGLHLWCDLIAIGGNGVEIRQ